MTALSWASLSTPLGPVSVGCSQAGVARVRYGAPPALGAGRPASSARGQTTEAADDLAETARAELAEYFRGGRRTFSVPVDLSGTAGSRRDVLTVLAAEVGYGQTTTYGALARLAGLPDGTAISRGDDRPQSPAVPAARAVGSIMAANPVPVIVPCHRVLASDGLGGYSGGAGIEVKRWLLILEGSLPPTLDWAARRDSEGHPAGW